MSVNIKFENITVEDDEMFDVGQCFIIKHTEHTDCQIDVVQLARISRDDIVLIVMSEGNRWSHPATHKENKVLLSFIKKNLFDDSEYSIEPVDVDITVMKRVRK